MKIWIVEDFSLDKNGACALAHDNIWYLASEELVYSFLRKHGACKTLGDNMPLRLGSIDGFWFVRLETKVEVCGIEMVEPEIRYFVRTVDVLEYV